MSFAARQRYFLFETRKTAEKPPFDFTWIYSPQRLLHTKQYQSPSRRVSIMLNPFSQSFAFTSSARGAIMPEVIKTASSFINAPTCDENIITTSATIFAATTSNLPVTLSARLPHITVNSGSVKPFTLPFSRAVLTASSSISTPTAFYAPKRSDAMDNIPLPQPVSRTDEPFFTYFSRASRHSLVVLCPPVPNASPGSIESTARLSELS